MKDAYYNYIAELRWIWTNCVPHFLKLQVCRQNYKFILEEREP